MKHHIFDLDHTVIDSSHRQQLKANGDLDLDHWIANRAVRELVFRDTLLPFASYWRALQLDSTPPSICTSRVISPLEYEFLELHGLRFEHFLHRGDSLESDGPYKVRKIRELLDLTGWEAGATTLYDDHPGVREIVKRELGLRVFDPVPFNRRGKYEAVKLVA